MSTDRILRRLLSTLVIGGVVAALALAWVRPGGPPPAGAEPAAERRPAARAARPAPPPAAAVPVARAEVAGPAAVPSPPPEPVWAPVLRAAVSALGTPYRYGGSGPGGFDCSGLTRWALAQAGVDLPRTSQAQRAASRPVAAAELQPGDLVFYYGASHVGIYVGDGQIIHAPRSGRRVEVVPLGRGGMAPSGFGRVL